MYSVNMKKQTAIVLIVVAAIIAFIAGASVFMGDYSEEDTAYIPESCNVLAFTMNGYLATYTTDYTAEELETDAVSSWYIADGIRHAEDYPNVKAVLLSIDSSGGDITTGEEIANALKALEIPSVALIRSMGASAAYWAATGADTIFASRISDVGSIGATASYLDETIKNRQEGYTLVELASAPHKDAGSPNRPLTTEERATVLSDLKKIHEVFVDDVASNRNLERDKVSELANGLTYLGVDSLEYGLIDKLGDFTAATDYISEQIGEPVELCWY
jgi:signal peptide peptidase SppA